ncbi:hypothetical protein GpartN1_g3977.t1 [Galdieria partita]|uniref:Uncharacterized protein n=1 Tax=Galdieria partita TaxID=83374 RepID=A0A9C7PX26_9RHOD|nr:hypothetical protein GpartN1_g3977.t1 [Galdieria partita]
MAFLSKLCWDPHHFLTTGFVVPKLELRKKCFTNQGKRYKFVCFGYIPVLKWCKKVNVCPVMVTTCFFSCCKSIEVRFALHLYLLRSNLKLLLYYPLISFMNMLFEWLLTWLTRLQQRFRLGFRDVINKVSIHKPFLRFHWLDGHIYVFHIARRKMARKTQKPRTAVEQAYCTLEKNCLNKYEEQINNYNRRSNIEETHMTSNQVNTKQLTENVERTESTKGNDDRLYSYLLEAKRNIESCIAERYTEADLTKNHPLQPNTTSTCSTLPNVTANSSTQKDRWSFVSYDVLTSFETFAGRIAMPALLICFLREYFEPGHPMLTSQILSLLPLQVYGDIAPSGYNPYITYISGLLKSETETRVTQLVHILFNLILSSLFAKLNVATNILKILLGS